MSIYFRDATLACTYDKRFDYLGGQPASYLPPNGVHGIVTINPCCSWVDGYIKSISVTLEAIAFHELAEVYAKVEFRMQYTEAHYHSGIMEEVLLRERPDFTASPAGEVVARIRFH